MIQFYDRPEGVDGKVVRKPTPQDVINGRLPGYR